MKIIQEALLRNIGKFKRESFSEDDDNNPESIFRATFGKKWYTWSFDSCRDSSFKDSESGFEWSEQSSWKDRSKRWENSSDVESDDELCTIGSYSDRTILGLPPTGPLKAEDVKKAFHLSALKWHPDKHEGPSQAMAAEKFKLCVNAYKSLCNALSLAVRIEWPCDLLLVMRMGLPYPVQIIELCLFCGDTTESAVHVLVMCPFAVATWDISMLTRHAHQGVQRSLHDVVVFAQQYVHEFITVNGTLSKVTNRVRDAFKWVALLSGRLKLNFDGAFDPTSGRGAVGVVAKDADGGFVAAMAKSVREVQSVEHAEILAAPEGVTLALSLGIASPIFEGDSAVVVAAVKRAGQIYSNIGTIVEDVKHLQK
ncbi:unnamed protein product [Prunus armeniaca]|uniref:J domain-containing protein n=1 Tax=Prunus armeniaca TaxID=36596 RepID=A0A6J5XIS0_PRUAR|nr:unnamed protein product [Prunus armeniaca]